MEKQIDPHRLARLQAAMRSLPVRTRVVFLALAEESASYPDLARRLGISVTDVEREFARALVALDAATNE